MSLARRWQQQDKQAEAYQLLFEVYTWFTTGFGTKDLKDAKALLSELIQGIPAFLSQRTVADGKLQLPTVEHVFR